MSNSLPSPPPPASASTGDTRKKKPQAENWDDDFEFSLPSSSKSAKKSSKASSSTTASSSKAKAGDENAPLTIHNDEGEAPGVGSKMDRPMDDWHEDWDLEDSPPQVSLPTPSITSSPSHESKKSSIPPPLSIPPNPYFQPPRLSPSHIAALPTLSPLLSSSTSQSHQPLLPTRSHTSLGLAAQAQDQGQGQYPGQAQSRSRSGSTTTGTVTRNKLVKRHPSTSFLPLPHRSSSNNLSSQTYYANDSEASLSSISYINRSSPNLPHPPVHAPPLPLPLPRSRSGEMMPPPPLPSSSSSSQYSRGPEVTRTRSRSKSKSRPGSKQEVIVSGIPFSPSRGDMREKEQVKKPGFWKRLSGAPSGSGNAEYGTPTQHRRRRSSSVGGNVTNTSSSPRPPVPPLPNNLRSPSATSSTSTSSNKSGPASAFSALLRRSSSSLSKRSDKSRDTPPSAYPNGSTHGRTSSSSVNSYVQQGMPVPSRRGDVTPDLPSSQSFSRGFHLPSPSPGSPYHPGRSCIPSTAHPGNGIIPPLPHSVSFPGPQGRGSGSDTETEGEGKTPKRRNEVRPVSALPASRMSSEKGWAGDSWKGISSGLPGPSSNIPRISGLPISRDGMLGELVGDVSNVSSTASTSGFGSTTSSTLRRLGSLSKKHGRRLSGGFKFGTNSSASSNESKSAARPLEPVLGSPSKPPRNTDTDDIPTSPISPTLGPSDEAIRNAIRAGSVSAPSSMFKPMPTHPSISGLDGLGLGIESDQRGGEAETRTDMEDVKKQEKHRRRQSWNDFIIPREVMARQKELKENIGAVKRFATGVTSLKGLLSTHDEMREQIMSSATTSSADAFTSLEAEFGQWLEMALVLIEVGSTGADASTQPSYSSPPRSRRVTLASDEAKAASAAMLKATSAPGGPGSVGGMSPPVQLAAWRKTSLPDPEDAVLSVSCGPPKADYPEQWRASTGRQDLSKRQLEVLRTMLRTPVTPGSGSGPDRPGMPSRAGSTLSASSTATSFLQLTPDRLGGRQQARVQPLSIGPSNTRSRTPESISFPSPGDSAHVVPSASFPSPLSAAKIAQPQSAQMKTLKERRASKAGLAGLKEFLRSLKKDRTPSDGSNKSAGLSTGGTSAGGLSPMRIRTRFGLGGGVKSSTSPPASPTSPLNPAFRGLDDGVFYPTQRTSFSALGLGSEAEHERGHTSASASALASAPMLSQMPSSSYSRSHSQSQFQLQSQSKGSRSRSTTMNTADLPYSASNSPRLGSEHKRPSIRNIFRTSSGNWSELVKGKGHDHDSLSPLPLSTVQFASPDLRPGSHPDPRTSTGTGTPSRSSSTSAFGGLTKKLSSHRLATLGGGSGSPKPAKGLVATPSGQNLGGRVSVSDPIPSRIPMPSSNSSSTLSARLNNPTSPQADLPPRSHLHRTAVGSTESDYGPSHASGDRSASASGKGEENEMEMTLKPNARKRVSGLGLGLGWPESPIKSASVAAAATNGPAPSSASSSVASTSTTPERVGGRGQGSSHDMSPRVDEMGIVTSTHDQGSRIISGQDRTLRPGQGRVRPHGADDIRSGDLMDSPSGGVSSSSGKSSRVPSYNTARTVSSISGTTDSSVDGGSPDQYRQKQDRPQQPQYPALSPAQTKAESQMSSSPKAPQGHSKYQQDYIHTQGSMGDLQDIHNIAEHEVRDIRQKTTHANENAMNEGFQEVDSVKNDLQIALTPENLPTLLEYLRQCEIKLGEWRGRVESLVGAAGGAPGGGP